MNFMSVGSMNKFCREIEILPEIKNVKVFGILGSCLLTSRFAFLKHM